MAFYDDNELNEIRVIQVYYGCSINISFPSLTLALTYVFSFWLWGWSFNLKCRAKSISNRTLTLWSKIHTEKKFLSRWPYWEPEISWYHFSLFFIFSSSLSFLSPLVTKEVGPLILSKRIHSQPACRIMSLLLFPLSAEVCKLGCVSESSESLLKYRVLGFNARVSDSVCLKWNKLRCLRICISNKFPSDAEAAGLGALLWEVLL